MFTVNINNFQLNKLWLLLIAIFSRLTYRSWALIAGVNYKKMRPCYILATLVAIYFITTKPNYMKSDTLIGHFRITFSLFLKASLALHTAAEPAIRAAVKTRCPK